MLRSLMTAVTGVKAHQVMLDVTGNNIANVNTTGFKRDFTIFQDLLYQTSQGASGPSDQRGGVNPAQVGLGVKVGAIETIHSQGFFQFTGDKNHMMIDGEGYFVFRDGGNQIYSRAGNFTLDGEKNLVLSGTGYYVQGYKMVRDPLNPTAFVRDGGLSDINIPMGQAMEARGTTLVGYNGNLNSETKAYLPIGHAGIPSNSTSTETQAPMTNGLTYKMQFISDLGASGGKDYFTVNVNNGNDNEPIKFNMTGISTGGTGSYPVFSLSTASMMWKATASGAASATYMTGASAAEVIAEGGTAQPIAYSDNGIITKGTYILPSGTGSGGTTMTVEYNNETGMLYFNNSDGGGPLWSTNLHENMAYEAFTLSSGNDTITFLTEFNEAEGKMDSSPLEMTVWWREAKDKPPVPPDPNEEEEDETGSNPDVITEITEDDEKVEYVMKKVVYNVYMNADGTFASTELKMNTDGTKPSTGDELPSGFYTWGHDLDLAVASGGRSLEFKAATAPDADGPDTGAAPTLSDTVGTINQGTEHSTKADIFDCQGKKYTMEVKFKKVAGNRWRWEASLPGQEKMYISPSSGEIAFDDSCKLVSPLNAQAVTIDFGMNATTLQTVLLDFSGQSFGLDVMQGITQFATESTTEPYYQDGYTMGVLSDYNVQQDGTIIGKYDNGISQAICRVALAQFANPMGLDKVGDTMFAESANSGKASINAAQTGGSGSIKSGNLEMSNVDLTEEFTKLIIAQRGFQANTRVVTTSDQILEEVVNLKR